MYIYNWYIYTIINLWYWWDHIFT